MTNLRKAASALDEYAAHAADEGHAGTVMVPVRLLQELRKALKQEEQK